MYLLFPSLVVMMDFFRLNFTPNTMLKFRTQYFSLMLDDETIVPIALMSLVFFRYFNRKWLRKEYKNSRTKAQCQYQP